MASRLNLQKDLEELLGSRNVYFQPPESIKLKFPCIVYDLSSIRKRTANNKRYLTETAYTVTVIDKNPASKIPDKLLDWNYCIFERKFVTDNLNHFVFRLYY